MSKLRNDPIRVIPKRVLLLALVFTVIAGVVSYILEWPIERILGGFWLGVIANLVSFRLIVIGTNRYLDSKEAGQGGKGGMLSNFGFRLLIYAVAITISWRLGNHALIASAVGVSMITIAVKLDGFFTIGYEKGTLNSAKDTDTDSSTVEQMDK